MSLFIGRGDVYPTEDHSQDHAIFAYSLKPEAV